MSSETVKPAFAEFNTACLQVAVNALNGDERVETIYVYTMFRGHSIEVDWYCRSAGRFLGIQEATKDVTGAEVSSADLTREVRPQLMAFMRAVIDGGEIPERIITEYDAVKGRAKSDWEYEGVVLGDDDTAGQARDRWIVKNGGKPVLS